MRFYCITARNLQGQLWLFVLQWSTVTFVLWWIRVTYLGTSSCTCPSLLLVMCYTVWYICRYGCVLQIMVYVIGWGLVCSRAGKVARQSAVVWVMTTRPAARAASCACAVVVVTRAWHISQFTTDTCKYPKGSTIVVNCIFSVCFTIHNCVIHSERTFHDFQI